ncbi:MAG: PilZ domain-containing protein [Pseudomonadota bacterium]
MSTTDEDREAERRLETRVDVDLWVDQHHASEKTFCRAVDISPGGLRFDLGLAHEVGTIVNLRFSLPGDELPIEVKAEVVGAGWHGNRPVTHLRFVDLSGDNHVRITRFVEERGGSAGG